MVVAFVIALWTLLDHVSGLYGLTAAYCAPASTAWLTRICCDMARPISMSGDSAPRKIGAASPNSTADMPLRSRASTPIRTRTGRSKADSRSDGRLGKERVDRL